MYTFIGCLKSKVNKFIKKYFFIIALMLLTGVLLFSALMLALYYIGSARESSNLENLSGMVDTCSRTDSESATDGFVVKSAQPVMLEKYRLLYEQNHDMIGWIKIDGTLIDYPVMHSPKDAQYYMNHNFDKKSAHSGLPFIDSRCAVNPFGTNTIIYGHYMNDGTMFTPLHKYTNEDFYKEHPIIEFDTLYAHQTYKIIAVFKSKIYNVNDSVFKYYNFLNAQNEAQFDKFIKKVKALSLYDTGEMAQYGDDLITLSTCAYHTENGKFVLVAKKVNERE